MQYQCVGAALPVALLCGLTAFAGVALADDAPTQSFVYDVDGDGIEETINTYPPTAPSTSSNATIRVFGSSETMPVFELPGSMSGAGAPGAFDRFAFMTRAAPGLTGSTSRELVVASPLRPGTQGNQLGIPNGLGGVSVFAAGNGAFRLAIPAPIGTRLALEAIDVPDQEMDGGRDLLLAGATWQVGGRWAPRSFLFSGTTGRLLTTRPESIATLLAFVIGGGSLYLPGDLDQSGSIDVLDLSAMLSVFHSTGQEAPNADLNHDGIVDGVDVQIQIDAYLAGRRSIAAASVMEVNVNPWEQFAASWQAVYDGELTVTSQSLSPYQVGDPFGSTMFPWQLPCACAGGSGEGTSCQVQITGCPHGGIVHAGFPIDFGAIGGRSDCTWSIVGAPGVLELDSAIPGRVRAIGPGTATVHLECHFGDCCACSECTLRVVGVEPPPPPPCEVGVEILCVGGQGQSAVVAGGHYRISAKVEPPWLKDGHFRWTVTSLDPTQTDAINVQETFLADWPSIVVTFGKPPAGGGDWAQNPRHVRVMVEFTYRNCPPAFDWVDFTLEADSDGDGLSDSREAVLETNPNNPDSDGDGWPDGCEVQFGSSPRNVTSIPAQAFWDTDKDGLSDAEELALYGTSPSHFDTDGDGVSDFAEVKLGLSSLTPPTSMLGLAQWLIPGHNYANCAGLISATQMNVMPPATSDLESTVFRAADKDHDLLIDSYERPRGLDPLNMDTDRDSVTDGIEVLSGRDPLVHNPAPLVPLADTDSDGLSDLVELYVTHTDPFNPDSDGDGLPDGWEVQYGLDPANADTGNTGVPDGLKDLDGDGLSNFEEFRSATDPLKQDSDGDGVSDRVEIDTGCDPLDSSDHGNPDESHLLDIVIYLTQFNVNCSVSSWTVTIGGQTFTFPYGTERVKARIRTGGWLPVSARPSIGSISGEWYAGYTLRVHRNAFPDAYDFANVDDHSMWWTATTGHTAFGSFFLTGTGEGLQGSVTPNGQFPVGEVGLMVPRIEIVKEPDPIGPGVRRFRLQISPAEVRQYLQSVEWNGLQKPPNFREYSLPDGITQDELLENGMVYRKDVAEKGKVHGFKLVLRWQTSSGTTVPGSGGRRSATGAANWPFTVYQTYTNDVRLAIDSLNNFGSIGSYMPEDYDVGRLSETEPKVVIAPSPDARVAGVPTYAVGHYHSWWQLPAGYSYSSAILHQRSFVPVCLNYPLDAWAQNGTVTLNYNASNPGGITRQADAQSPTGYVYTLPPGNFRLWLGDWDDPKDYRSVLDSPQGAFVPAGTPIPLRRLDPDGKGVIRFCLDAVRPSASFGSDSIRAEVFPRVARRHDWAQVAVASVQFSMHDLRHWGPRRGTTTVTIDIGHPQLSSPSPIGDQSRVQGAITDGVSAIVIQATPAINPDKWRVSAELWNQMYYDYDVDDWRCHEGYGPSSSAFGWLKGVPDEGRLATMRALPLVESEEMADPNGFRFDQAAKSPTGTFIYVPPDSFSETVGCDPRDTYFRAVDEVQPYWIEIMRVAQRDSQFVEDVATHQAAGRRAQQFLGYMECSLRRPPLVMVHGITGNPTGYWGQEAFNETTAQPLPTRLYFADYSENNTRGFDINWPAVPRAIASALADYRQGNDDVGEHSPWIRGGGMHHVAARGFFGLRYAATRADVVAHSMGGQLTRLFISDVSSLHLPRDGELANTVRLALGNLAPLAPLQWEPYDLDRHLPNEPVVGTEPYNEWAWPYLRDDNYGAGDIRYFVSLGTPYRGSTLALLSHILLDGSPIAIAARAESREHGINFDSFFEGSNGRGPTGWFDLAPGSLIQTKLETAFYPTGRRAVRWFPIATTFSATTPWQYRMVGMAASSVSDDMIPALQAAGFPTSTASDGIVVVSSGLHDAPARGLRFRLVPGCGHSEKTPGLGVRSQMNSPVVAEEIRYRLSGPADRMNNHGLGE